MGKERNYEKEENTHNQFTESSDQQEKQTTIFYKYMCVSQNIKNNFMDFS